MLNALKLIWTITATVTLLQAANGLWQVLLPLRMQAEGMATVTIGYVATAYGVGFAIGCWFTPLLVRHVGHIRTFASLAALSAIIALVFSQASSPITWIVLRGIAGLSMAGLFTVSDSWTSSCATAENRGRVLSIYMVFNKIALVLAPLVISLGSIKGDGLFMTVAAFFCFSIIPICAANTKEPPPPKTVRINLGKIITLAPSAAIGSVVVGLMNGPVTNLATVYGVSIGMSNAVAAGLLFAIQGGNLAMQWPLGVISDRFDRRHVIAGLGGATALVSLLAIGATLVMSVPLIFLAIFLWGGIALCIYAICVAHVCDVVPPEEIVPSVSGLLLLWAIGMAIGPAPAAYVMQTIAPWALFLYSACIALFLMLFVIWRIHYKKRDSVTSGIIPITPTSPATAPLDPRTGPINVEHEPAPPVAADENTP